LLVLPKQWQANGDSMIICNRNQADSLISDPSNFLRNDERNNAVLRKAEFIEMPSKGRGLGNKNKSDDERIEVAQDSITGLSNREVAEKHNVSLSSVSAYKNGATSTSSYNEKDEALQKSNDEVKIIIGNQVKNKLLQTLEAITPDKITKAKLGELTNLAHGMSGILKHIEPSDENQNKGNGPQFIFMVPEQKREEHYKIIELNAEKE